MVVVVAIYKYNSKKCQIPVDLSAWITDIKLYNCITFRKLHAALLSRYLTILCIYVI